MYIRIRVKETGNVFWNLDVDIPEHIKYYPIDVLYDIGGRWLYKNQIKYFWFRVLPDEFGNLVRNKN